MDLPALSLAAALAVPAPQAPVAAPVPGAAAAAPVAVDAAGTATTWDAGLAALGAKSVVVVGESHDSAHHHRVQAETVEGLAARGLPVSVGFEMVSFEDQAVLDAFLSGATGETAFAAWWKTNWGYDYALYKPIFDVIRARGLPAHGLNAPRDLVKAVARRGLAGLTPAERARLPASIQESADARYRDYVRESLNGHGPLPPDVAARMTQVQAVWNETMGEKAAAAAAGGRTLVVIVGQGHAFYGAGLPESARRRGASAAVLLPWPLDGDPAATPLPDRLQALRASGELALADWFRLEP